MAKNAVGASQIKEFHRQLFTNSANALRRALKKIIGVPVCEATGEVETTTGTMVQVFLLAHNVGADRWNLPGSGTTRGKESCK